MKRNARFSVRARKRYRLLLPGKWEVRAVWAEFCPYLALGNYVILFYDSELFLQHLRHPEKLNLHKTQHVPGEYFVL